MIFISMTSPASILWNFYSNFQTAPKSRRLCLHWIYFGLSKFKSSFIHCNFQAIKTGQPHAIIAMVRKAKTPAFHLSPKKYLPRPRLRTQTRSLSGNNKIIVNDQSSLQTEKYLSVITLPVNYLLFFYCALMEFTEKSTKW